MRSWGLMLMLICTVAGLLSCGASEEEIREQARQDLIAQQQAEKDAIRQVMLRVMEAAENEDRQTLFDGVNQESEMTMRWAELMITTAPLAALADEIDTELWDRWEVSHRILDELAERRVHAGAISRADVVLDPGGESGVIYIKKWKKTERIPMRKLGDHWVINLGDDPLIDFGIEVAGVFSDWMEKYVGELKAWKGILEFSSTEKEYYSKLKELSDHGGLHVGQAISEYERAERVQAWASELQADRGQRETRDNQALRDRIEAMANQASQTQSAISGSGVDQVTNNNAIKEPVSQDEIPLNQDWKRYKDNEYMLRWKAQQKERLESMKKAEKERRKQLEIPRRRQNEKDWTPDVAPPLDKKPEVEEMLELD